MPVALTYPGVYIQELNSGVRTITGVATSITAFVGYTARGRDNFAVRLFSYPDFERAFGGLSADSELSYAVKHFFDNGGSDAYVVRIPNSDAMPSEKVLPDTTAVPATPTATPTPAPEPIRVTARSKGEWGNKVVINVDYTDILAADTKAFNLTITDLGSGITERFANVTMDKTKSNFVDKVVNNSDNGSKLVSVKADPQHARPLATGTVGGDVTLPAQIDGTKEYLIQISSDKPDKSIQNVPVVVIAKGEAPPTSLLGMCRLLENKANLELQKKIPGASIRCVPSGKGIQVTGVISDALEAKITFVAVTVSGSTEDADAFLKLSTGTPNLSNYLLSGGSDGTQLPGNEDLIGKESDFSGIYALDKVDLFNLLCIPDATRAQAGDSDKLDSTVDPNQIFGQALTYCKKRRAFLLIDPPPEVTDVATAIDWKTSGLTVKGKDAAAYFPRLKLADPLNKFQLRSFAPCGVIAGLYARTDTERGVWKAPAGTAAVLQNVQSLAYKLTDGEHGALNPLGLNCCRTFPIHGNVSWGARTLDGADANASEWKYVPVRRLALFIEESLYRGTQWVLFEPNDEPLWAQIRLNIGAFMQNLFRQGAFQGASKQDAYFVKCDKETTTQNDINLGIVNIVVGFAPLKPAEFVVISLQQMAGQIAT
jgi:hypothetical protein